MKNIVKYSMGKNFLCAALSMILLSACNHSSNQTPLANAGDDQKVLVGDTVVLDGAASTLSGNVVWTFESVPSGSSATISESNSLQPTFVADVAGTYVAKLSLENGESTDTVSVTAKNVLAAITAVDGSAISTRTRFGSTEYVMNLSQENGQLSGTNSRGSLSSYLWEQVDGPGATTTNGTTASSLTFTAPSLTQFQSDSDQYKWQPLPVWRNGTRMLFKLTVSDGNGNSDTTTFPVYLQDSGSEIHPSSGLPNVGLGTNVYLSGPAKVASSAPTGFDVVSDWSWSLSRPSGSSATFADTATSNSTLQFPRFTPDVAGLYTVTYTSTTGKVTTAKSIVINAGNYVGVGVIAGASPRSPECGTCHNGVVQGDKVTPWSETKHAHIFQDNVSSYASQSPESYLWEFHTVGFNKSASNGGFDDLMSSASQSFSSDINTFDLFSSNFPNATKLSGVQCESCHGPGSEHRGVPNAIAVSFSQSGTCGQCHLQESQWIHSGHNMTGVSHGRSVYQSAWLGKGCQRCHTSKGFAAYVEDGEEGLVSTLTDTGLFVGATCIACHDPHDASKEKQLRALGNVTMLADQSVVNAGKAAVCYTCHDGLYNHNEKDCDTDGNGVADAVCLTPDQDAKQYFRGVHYNPQAPVLEGKGGVTDINDDGTPDFDLTENSFHGESGFILSAVTGDPTLPSENLKCVTCHMAEGPSSDEPGFNHLGGHSFAVRSGHNIGHLHGEESDPGSPEAAGDLENLKACTNCHVTLSSFNRTARGDYDGDGIVEGIQDEVQGVLFALAKKIRTLDSTHLATAVGSNGTTSTADTDGVITPGPFGYAGSKTSFKVGEDCNTPPTDGGRAVHQQCNFIDADVKVRKAIWNHNMIVRDGSFGIHNAAYIIQLLQKTYAALGGNSFATDYPKATIR